MKSKKRSFTETGGTILLILIGIFLYNILNGLQGLTLTFSGLNQSSLLSKYSDIHFSSEGNDFGGGIFWLPTDSLDTPQTITAGSVSKLCRKQLRGIYYNAARGARLWPLDIKTLALLTGTGGQGYENLQVNGGLYTACGTGDDQYGIFGYISYDWLGTRSAIIAGVQLNYKTNDYIPQFANNLQYFNNISPLGYFWDSVGGIGFVGGNISGNQELLDYLNSTGSINTSFSGNAGGISSSSGSWTINPSSGTAQDTMWNILIQGNVILSKAIDVYEKRALLGNLEKKTILINSDINSATVINLAKKNAEILCRGKTYSQETTLPISQEKILCYKNTNVTINLNDELHKDKTIVMKNGNISLYGSMQKDSSALDIFIDQGNLYIGNNPLTKTSFNQDGYPSDNNITNSGIFIKGNFVVNGLLLGGSPTNTTAIQNKLHLLGKIAFLNTPTTPSQGRILQVSNVLQTDFSNRISLENVFSRYCNFNGSASDGTACGSGSTSTTITPFVVLNANYPSNIIK